MADDLVDVGDNLADVPAFYTGTGTSNLVPSVFPVAINGRPYMVDRKDTDFSNGLEPRVRDSVDQNTEPGEGTLTTQGLWRRGQTSWHAGAGQEFADDAAAQPYRFYKSKGVNPWVKGRLSLLNATKVSLTNSSTTQHMVVQDGRVYVTLNGDVKYTTDPFAATPTWTPVVDETAGTAAPTGTVAAMATDGNKVYLAYPSDGIRQVLPATDPAIISNTKFATGSDSYYMLGFAKGFMFGAHDKNLKSLNASGTASDVVQPDDATWKWVGVATGQNAVYAAGYSGKKSLVYKITIKTDGTLDGGVVALELPTGEVVSAISGYLGFILLGTNKGVRFCATDSQANLVAGQLIPTSGEVKKFASNDRFAYFTWTNYDGVSGGLGRLDLSQFIAPNTPAFATDVMYDSTNAVTNVVMFDDGSVTRPVFMISAVGVIVEDSSTLVSSGEIETGKWKWGIQDRKFVAFTDLRTEPLAGTVELYASLDSGDYDLTGTFNTTLGTEFSSPGAEDKAITAQLKAVLKRSATVTVGPVVTRLSVRAYATPARSRYFRVPVILHHTIDMWGRTYHFDVLKERDLLEDLCLNPRVFIYQEGNTTYSVIAEDYQFKYLDTADRDWTWEGTATITMRSIQE